MTATEFQIAPALQPLHAGGVHICVAERGGFEPSRPFISHMLPRSHAHFLLRGRILSIIFIGVWEHCQRHPCSGMAQAIIVLKIAPRGPTAG